jgi:hypothetical protein
MPSSISSFERSARESPGFVRLTASDRPGVAQPVPERDIPLRPWRSILLGALAMATLLVAGWEMYWRMYGVTPGYRNSDGAWAQQRRIHEEVIAGGEEAILLLEHPPVVTMGRRGETMGVTNLRAWPPGLRALGVEFVQSDRGGDITFHGPGQLVCYPILRLAERKISVGRYVKLLQSAVIAVLAGFQIAAETDEAGIGVWVRPPDDERQCREYAQCLLPHVSSNLYLELGSRD